MTSLKKGDRVFTGYLRYYGRLGKAFVNRIAICKPGTQRRFREISGRRAWMSRSDIGMDGSDSQPPAVTSSCSYGWGKLRLTVPVVGWSKRLMFCWCKLCITGSLYELSHTLNCNAAQLSIHHYQVHLTLEENPHVKDCQGLGNVLVIVAACHRMSPVALVLLRASSSAGFASSPVHTFQLYCSESYRE
ncbi:hypothetical protein M404DRAFT_717765 [Pisolithus tinctorius Marx 270]|uniref:Uncharacterized protein n=1 Tax=Pisolithus tinctorius Marx 270 TaxID=870435 RepID=A0A0C3IYQ3_PISTI|nr:hypothetical protein M404DRAFT_717765 [Pisolithus tinctorius Marx 270]